MRHEMYIPTRNRTRTRKVSEFIEEGKAAGIDLSACDFQHIDRSNPDMMEASLKSIIRAEAIAEAGKPVHVHVHSHVHARVHVVPSTAIYTVPLKCLCIQFTCT